VGAGGKLSGGKVGGDDVEKGVRKSLCLCRVIYRLPVGWFSPVRIARGFTLVDALGGEG